MIPLATSYSWVLQTKIRTKRSNRNHSRFLTKLIKTRVVVMLVQCLHLWLKTHNKFLNLKVRVWYSRRMRWRLVVRCSRKRLWHKVRLILAICLFLQFRIWVSIALRRLKGWKWQTWQEMIIIARKVKKISILLNNSNSNKRTTFSFWILSHRHSKCTFKILNKSHFKTHLINNTQNLQSMKKILMTEIL